MTALKQVFYSSMRTLIVLLTFTMDVKVRADVVLQSFAGQVEMEKDGHLMENLKSRVKFSEPMSVQTFSKSHAKLMINSVYWGAGSQSFFEVSERPDFTVHHGFFFVRTPHSLKLKTHQGDLELTTGSFIIQADDHKTFITAIEGSAEVNERSSSRSQNVLAGYTTWIGDLLANGTHARGRPEACDFEVSVATMKWLGPDGTEKNDDFQLRKDKFRIVWRRAVDDAAQGIQREVDADMKIYSTLEEARRRRAAEEKSEIIRLKKMFRAKVLGVPGQSEPTPKESNRVPASAD